MGSSSIMTTTLTPIKPGCSRLGSYSKVALFPQQSYKQLVWRSRRSNCNGRSMVCASYSQEPGKKPGTDSGTSTDSTSIQLYSEIEKIITETARQSQGGWASSGNWTEIEGSWVLRSKLSEPTSVVHFIGGIFVGAAPQLTYRYFLESLADKGALVIATPFASGFDHFLIADEVQFKFDRCMRYMEQPIKDLPSFGVGHSLGSLIHLLIGSRYAIQRSGNALMSFNNKEASLAIPLFSPVIVPMAQSFGPILSQLTSSPNLLKGVGILLPFSISI